MPKNVVFGWDMAGFNEEEARHTEVSGGGQAMGEIASGETYNAVLNYLKSAILVGDKGMTYSPYGPTEVDDRVIAMFRDDSELKAQLPATRLKLFSARHRSM